MFFCWSLVFSVWLLFCLVGVLCFFVVVGVVFCVFLCGVFLGFFCCFLCWWLFCVGGVCVGVGCGCGWCVGGFCFVGFCGFRVSLGEDSVGILWPVLSLIWFGAACELKVLVFVVGDVVVIIPARGQSLS